MYPRIDHNCMAYDCHNTCTNVGNAPWEFVFCVEHQRRLLDGEALYLGRIEDLAPLKNRVDHRNDFKLKGKVGIGGETEIYGMKVDVNTPLKDLSPYS